MGDQFIRLLRILFIVAAAYVAYHAGREYVQIAWLHKPPAHPFGGMEKWMSIADRNIYTGLAGASRSYTRFMLLLCLGSSGILFLFVLSWFVQKLLKYAFVLLFLVAAYYIYQQYK